MRILKKNHAFSRIIKQGKRLRGKYLTIHYRKRRDLDDSRIGVTCNKGIGNAVERNYLKRRLRAIARTLLPELPSSHDFVFTARPFAKEAEYQAMLREARRLCDQAGLLRTAREEEGGS